MPRGWGFSSFFRPGGGGLLPRGGEFAHPKNCQGVLPGGMVRLEIDRYITSAEESVTMLSRVVTKRKRHCQHLFLCFVNDTANICSYASHRDKRSQQCRQLRNKRQRVLSVSLKIIPEWGFTLLYKMISNEPGPVESETPGSEIEKIKSKRKY